MVSNVIRDLCEMYHNEHQIVAEIYGHFYRKTQNGLIPISLRAPSLVGTVQDDPFDCYIHEEIENAFPDLEVVSSGKLTTPDIVIRDRSSGIVVGLEVKKLIQSSSGSDSRGLTMDYNSCLPCGTTLIRVGNAVREIPCYYLFCLLTPDSGSILTLIMMHGDFINYDFNLHKEAKTANITEYGHGPYGEGSVRRRAMYTYPNPLNYKLSCFFKRKVLVLKIQDMERLGYHCHVTENVSRVDKFDNNFIYTIVDAGCVSQTPCHKLIFDVFAGCKERTPRKRNNASMPVLEE